MMLTLFRRSLSTFLCMSAALALGACGPELSGSEGAGLESTTAPLLTGATARLRLMAANISSGNYQSYDPGDGGRIFQGTKPDIVMIQEFNYKTGSTADVREFVNTYFDSSFSVYRESGAQIPNGIISRYPIVESGEWTDSEVSNRDFAWARIDIPGPVDLWAVSVHLLTRSSSARQSEASQLVNYIKGKVPTGDYLVIGGDFNTGSRDEAAVNTLRSVVVTTNPPPVDCNGKSGTNASRAKPFDWVLADTDLDAYKTSTVIGTRTFPTGLVADTRTYSPIADISPARAGDSGATNMQHMGIVRDFLIPTGTP